jgi:hypothetical protein
VLETRRLQTCAAWKGRSLPKETAVRRKYEGGGPGLHVPSRNTGRGVHSRGKPKGPEARRRRETNMHTASLRAGKVRSLKGLEVTVVRLETGRSIPGQGEVRRKLGGGPKGC